MDRPANHRCEHPGCERRDTIGLAYPITDSERPNYYCRGHLAEAEARFLKRRGAP